MLTNLNQHGWMQCNVTRGEKKKQKKNKKTYAHMNTHTINKHKPSLLVMMMMTMIVFPRHHNSHFFSNFSCWRRTEYISPILKAATPPPLVFISCWDGKLHFYRLRPAATIFQLNTAKRTHIIWENLLFHMLAVDSLAEVNNNNFVSSQSGEGEHQIDCIWTR